MPSGWSAEVPSPSGFLIDLGGSRDNMTRLSCDFINSDAAYRAGYKDGYRAGGELAKLFADFLIDPLETLGVVEFQISTDDEPETGIEFQICTGGNRHCV